MMAIRQQQMTNATDLGDVQDLFQMEHLRALA